jgi:hypothetical protein
MSSKARVMSKLAEVGATFELDPNSDFWEADLWLPAGKTWEATGCHLIYICAMNAREGWNEAMYLLSAGVGDCNTERCDTCTEAQA